MQSDTGVEDHTLSALSHEMMDLLRTCGWECVVVRPAVNQKLYNRILGIGNTPVYPGTTSMRWCTRSTKIDPMDQWREENSSGLTLTGLRLGESKMRDGKIKKGCAAGGECGLPDIDERTYSPLLRWTTCHVIDWLNGDVANEVTSIMGDVFRLTRKLVEIYRVQSVPTLEGWDPVVSAARFGCQGCPAIEESAVAPKSVVARNGAGSPLNEIYAVWHEARLFKNRCFATAERMAEKSRGQKLPGPIRMAVRKILFERIMDIQRRSGVVLVTPEDEAFIRDCWERKVYPRDWSEADELNPMPEDAPLFDTLLAPASKQP